MPNPIDLLQQIANNTAANDSVWVAAISGGAAVLGAFAGALVSYFVAKKAAESQLQVEAARLRATVVTTERLRWLQDIRQRLSKLYRQVDIQYDQLKRPVPQGQAAQFQQALDELSAEIMEQANIITLMLNPNKSEQAALRDSLQETLGFLLGCFTQRNTGNINFNGRLYASIKQKAFDSMTHIGIQAWDRIQKLE